MATHKIDYFALLEKVKLLLTTDLGSSATVGYDEPTDKTHYPFVRITGIEKPTEFQLAATNIPEVGIIVPLEITCYRGGATTQTQAAMREQAYDLLAQIEEVIRTYPTFDNWVGCILAMNGGFSPQPSGPGFFRLGLDWVMKIVVPKT